MTAASNPKKLFEGPGTRRDPYLQPETEILKRGWASPPPWSTARWPGDVEVADGLVVAVGLGEPVGEKIAAPGFVDLQVNGYAGVDFSAPGEDGYARAGAALLAAGVTAFQPTIVSGELEAMRDSLAQVPATDPGPRLIGAHLEGPFLSRARAGAHDPGAIRPPDLGTSRRCSPPVRSVR